MLPPSAFASAVSLGGIERQLSAARDFFVLSLIRGGCVKGQVRFSNGALILLTRVAGCRASASLFCGDGFNCLRWFVRLIRLLMTINL